MKIAMLIDGWTPIFGGGQVHVKYLSELLVKNYNCQIDLFVRKLKDKKGNKYINNEIKYGGKLKIFRIGPTTEFFNFYGRIFSLINTTLKLFFKAKKEKYDLIHAHAYVSGIPAKIVGYLLKIPVVYTVHGTMNLDKGEKNFNYYLEKFLVIKIKYNKIISVSHKIYNYNPKTTNIVILPNGVDLNLFENVKVKEKYDGISFLFVGRFAWQKGLEYLFKGIGLIDKSFLLKNNFQLNLVGDGEETEKLKRLAIKLGIEKFIKFKGKKFGKDLVIEYKRNHVFILPSLAEGQPITLLEAFASQLPVIATDVGDNRYFINNYNGRLIDSGDEKQIAEVVKKIITINFSKLMVMGQNGFNLVKNNFTWEKVVKKTLSEYIKLIN